MGRERLFASLRQSADDRASTPDLVLPADALVGADAGEPNFSGFLWDEASRLWVEWKDGKPVAATALIGEP